jgi:hypothetical protein
VGFGVSAYGGSQLGVANAQTPSDIDGAFINFSIGGGTGLGGGDGGGGGGGGGGAGVNKSWGGPIPCTKSAAQVASYLQQNFATLASTAVTTGPVVNIVSFSTPNGIAPGSQINASVVTMIPTPLAGFPGSITTFQVPGASAQLTVQSTSAAGFVAKPDSSVSPLNGTLSFNVAAAGNGQVNFTIQANATYSNTTAEVLGYLGKTLENGIWNNLVSQIAKYCQ